MGAFDEVEKTAWLRADIVLAYVLTQGGGDVTRASEIARVRAASMVAGGGIVETYYLEACRKAGIEFRWSDPQMAIVDAVAYIPAWAGVFIECTFAKSVQQSRVLRRANTDPSYREAGLAIWRLRGVDALVRWFEEYE